MWTLESQPCPHVEFIKELAPDLTKLFSSSITFALSKILFNNNLEPTLLTLHIACDLPATSYRVKWDGSGMDSCNPRFSGLENRFVVLSFFHAPPLTWKGLCTSGKPRSWALFVTQNSRYHVRGHSQWCRNIYILYRPPGAIARSSDSLGRQSPCFSLKSWLSKSGQIWSQ